MKTDDRPIDCATFMDRALIVAVIIVLLLAYGMVGTWDYSDALTAEAQDKADRAETASAAGKSGAELSTLFDRPLPCDAIVNGKCYISRTTRARLEGDEK